MARPIRIAGASGSASDRRNAFRNLAQNYPNDPVDVIVGDFMSEANMIISAAKKADATVSSKPTVAYESSFLQALEPALHSIAQYGIRVAVNAGASDTKKLHEAVVSMVSKKGLKLKVAWIEGDEVLDTVQKMMRAGEEEFVNVSTGMKLEDWKFEPIAAQAYLGGLGIAAAFENGADIVVCGRVSDASPVIGAAYWWHRWNRNHLHELANTFVAGHLIECSTYVCGGNWSGFKQLEDKKWHDIGYPIAEISALGQVVITKQKESGGMVTEDTCKAQLLYEIQGPWYFNSDVTAILDEISFEQLESDRVALKGVKASEPPPTTKVGITARGGYQAEVHWFLVGLDIEAKARMMEQQIRRELGDLSRFSLLKFTLNGSVLENADKQEAATVDFRVFAQAPEVTSLASSTFLKPILDTMMMCAPGATAHLDFRQGIPKPIYEYHVTLLLQSEVQHRVHTHDGKIIPIAPPSVTRTHPSQQPQTSLTSNPSLREFKTLRGPLGWLVHARSGDKGSNANVGFWVRSEEEYDWLRTLLSTEKLKELLGEEYKHGKKIDRFELPNLWGVHFLLHNHLDRGVSCTSSYDFLGKNLAEFLRCRHVDLPKRFLNKGIL